MSLNVCLQIFLTVIDVCKVVAFVIKNAVYVYLVKFYRHYVIYFELSCIYDVAINFDKTDKIIYFKKLLRNCTT